MLGYKICTVGNDRTYRITHSVRQLTVYYMYEKLLKLDNCRHWKFGIGTYIASIIYTYNY